MMCTEYTCFGLSVYHLFRLSFEMYCGVPSSELYLCRRGARSIIYNMMLNERRGEYFTIDIHILHERIVNENIGNSHVQIWV